MKIGPDFEITRDRYNYIVIEWANGTDKDGNPKRQKRESYHGTLLQACNRVQARITDEALAGTVKEVIAAITRAEAAVRDAIAGRAA